MPSKKRQKVCPDCDWTCPARLRAVKNYARLYARGEVNSMTVASLFRHARRMGLIKEGTIRGRQAHKPEQIDRKKLKLLWLRGMVGNDIAEKMNIHPMSVYRIAGELGLPKRPRGRPKPGRKSDA